MRGASLYWLLSLFWHVHVQSCRRTVMECCSAFSKYCSRKSSHWLPIPSFIWLSMSSPSSTGAFAQCAAIAELMAVMHYEQCFKNVVNNKSQQCCCHELYSTLSTWISYLLTCTLHTYLLLYSTCICVLLRCRIQNAISDDPVFVIVLLHAMTVPLNGTSFALLIPLFETYQYTEYVQLVCVRIEWLRIVSCTGKTEFELCFRCYKRRGIWVW